jgi:hypothetical protein
MQCMHDIKRDVRQAAFGRLLFREADGAARQVERPKAAARKRFGQVERRDASSAADVQHVDAGARPGRRYVMTRGQPACRVQPACVEG